MLHKFLTSLLTTGFLLFLNRRSINPITPAAKRPKSSFTPRDSAALNPIKDHTKGIKDIFTGIFKSIQSSKPKVKIVVGQGAIPKDGDRGKPWPK